MDSRVKPANDDSPLLVMAGLDSAIRVEAGFGRGELTWRVRMPWGGVRASGGFLLVMAGLDPAIRGEAGFGCGELTWRAGMPWGGARASGGFLLVMVGLDRGIDGDGFAGQARE